MLLRSSKARRGVVIALVIFFCFIFLLQSLGAFGANPAVGDQNWAMFHHDLVHSGSSPSAAPNTNNILWNYTTGDNVVSSPAVVDDKVYIGSDDCKVYCLNATTGAKVWSYTTGNIIFCSYPAVVDGKVYIGSNDDKVYCLDAASGEYIWSYKTDSDVESSPAVANGKVYIGSEDTKVYCLDAATGTYIWSYTTGNGVRSSLLLLTTKST